MKILVWCLANLPDLVEEGWVGVTKEKITLRRKDAKNFKDTDKEETLMGKNKIFWTVFGINKGRG